MIFAWLTARGFLGLAKGLWLLGAIVALIGAVAWLRAAENADDKANQAIGRTIEREEALGETVKQVEQANEAREDNRTRTDDQRHADCLRRSRTPENCL